MADNNNAVVYSTPHRSWDRNYGKSCEQVVQCELLNGGHRATVVLAGELNKDPNKSPNNPMSLS